MGKEGSMRYEEIKQLIDLFEETDLAEMELTRENDGLRLVRGNAGRTVSQPAAVAQPEIPEAPSLSDLQDIVASVQNGAREAMAGDSAAEAATEARRRERLLRHRSLEPFMRSRHRTRIPL